MQKTLFKNADHFLGAEEVMLVLDELRGVHHLNKERRFQKSFLGFHFESGLTTLLALMLLVRKSCVSQRNRWAKRTKIPMADSLFPPKLSKAEPILLLILTVFLLLPKRIRWPIRLMRKAITRMPMNESR